jgi:hypothetical protein
MKIYIDIYTDLDMDMDMARNVISSVRSHAEFKNKRTFAILSYGLFLTCRGKINNYIHTKIRYDSK